MKIKKRKNQILNNISEILIRWGFSKRGLFSNAKGEWYLFSQLLLISLHLLPAYPRPIFIIYPLNLIFLIGGILLSINGLIISLKAFIDLGNNLTPLPYPMKESILIINNSYKHSRHPLYKGLILISLGVCIASLSISHLFLFISLSILLKHKALKEEERLIKKFPEYKNYMKKIPAITKNIKYFDWRS